MPATIGCDAHKQFSVFVTIDGKGKTSPAVRVEHHRQESIGFLHSLPAASEIALEATGHWYSYGSPTATCACLHGYPF